MKRAAVWLAAATMASRCWAGDFETGSGRHGTGWWKRSASVLVAAIAADAHSSMGKRETNPLLRSGSGRFEAKGVAIKAGMAGAALGLEWLLVRRSPQAAKAATVVNFGLSGALGAAAVHNYGNRKPAGPRVEMGAQPVVSQFP